jgi:hypothetical protein
MVGPQLAPQGLVLIFEPLHRRKDILNLYEIFHLALNFFDLLHQVGLHLYAERNYSADELSFMLALKQQVQNYLDDLFDGLTLYDLLLVSPHDLFALSLHQVLLNGVEVLLRLQVEVVEALEVMRTDPLQQPAEEGSVS